MKRMRKNIETLILYVGITMVILFLFGQYLCERSENKMRKPDSVPASAIWAGGDDGGYWAELVETRGDTIRIKFYQDWNGDLLFDNDYVPEIETLPPQIEVSWKDFFSFFDGTTIYFKDKDGSAVLRYVQVDSVCCFRRDSH